MPTSVRCPFCSAAVTAEAGQSVTCTACGATFVAQGSSAPPPPPPVYMPPSAGPAPSAGDMPCPMCGEMIKAGAKVCRFCKAQLGPLPTGMPPAPPQYGYNAPPPQKKSNCLLWVILGIVGGGILLCIGVPALMWFFGKEEIGKQMCKTNFEQHLAKEVRENFGPDAEKKIQDEKEKEFRKNLEKYEDLRGTDFWRKVAQDAGNDQAAFCGAALLKGDQRVYRGPKKPISEYGPDDPIGHCPTGYHKEGVWIIYKSGKYEFVSESSDAFKKAKELLQD